MNIRKKNGIFLVVAIILVALIGGISTVVYSSTGSKVIIGLDDNRIWECKKDFDSSWYVNMKKADNDLDRKISFEVDLSKYIKQDDDYENLKANVPFVVNVGVVNKDSTVTDITKECMPEISIIDEKVGVFKVSINTLANINGGDNINVSVSFQDKNIWGIEPQVQNFYLIEDSTKPEFTIENFEEVNGKVLVDTIELKCKTDEINLDKIVVSGSWIESEWAAPKEINDVLWGENKNTVGEKATLKYDEGKDTLSIYFNALGYYNATITFYDKAGNYYSQNIEFQKTVTKIEPSLVNMKKHGEVYYTNNKNIKLEFHKYQWITVSQR